MGLKVKQNLAPLNCLTIGALVAGLSSCGDAPPRIDGLAVREGAAVFLPTHTAARTKRISSLEWTSLEQCNVLSVPSQSSAGLVDWPGLGLCAYLAADNAILAVDIESGALLGWMASTFDCRLQAQVIRASDCLLLLGCEVDDAPVLLANCPSDSSRAFYPIRLQSGSSSFEPAAAVLSLPDHQDRLLSFADGSLACQNLDGTISWTCLLYALPHQIRSTRSGRTRVLAVCGDSALLSEPEWIAEGNTPPAFTDILVRLRGDALSESKQEYIYATVGDVFRLEPAGELVVALGGALGNGDYGVVLISEVGEELGRFTVGGRPVAVVDISEEPSQPLLIAITRTGAVYRYRLGKEPEHVGSLFLPPELDSTVMAASVARSEERAYAMMLTTSGSALVSFPAE